MAKQRGKLPRNRCTWKNKKCWVVYRYFPCVPHPIIKHNSRQLYYLNQLVTAFHAFCAVWATLLPVFVTALAALLTAVLTPFTTLLTVFVTALATMIILPPTFPTSL